ncbi:MAG: hypothetical protein ABJE47_22845 [bacterium]
MNIAVQLEPATSTSARVEYRWDGDTDILTAHVKDGPAGMGMSGSVELGGPDGSWLILDVAKGRIGGVEVAIWPPVQKRSSLSPPTSIEDLQVLIPARASQPGVASLEMEMPLIAESDAARTIIHFRVGPRREFRVVRLAKDLLLELDPHSRIAGVWMLNVPPSPST